MATKNDYRRLKDEADIAAVIAYLNIPVKKMGYNYFIPCPHPDHADQHPTNCYFRDGWNNVFCTACGKSMKALDIIMRTLGCSYGEAADILWEIEGCPEWYYAKREKKKKNSFSITREEAAIIGIHYPGHLLSPCNISTDKEELSPKHEYDNSYIQGYLECKVHRFTYRDFMTDKQYTCIVKNKALEQIRKFSEIEQFLKELLSIEKGKQDRTTRLLLESCQANKKICVDIYNRAKIAAA